MSDDGVDSISALIEALVVQFAPLLRATRRRFAITDEETEELEGEIGESVATLAPPRDLVVRLYLAGFHRLEIAQLLEWSEPKVRSLLYRGLSDLGSALGERGVRPGVFA